VSTTTGTRRRARELTFRLAYQADLLGERYSNVWRTVQAEERLSDDQRQLIDDVVGFLETRAAEVDDVLARSAERWELDRLAATDRSVLRTAIAELWSRPGTPARVVLDEAIEIAKRFGSEESGRFVNGVLDRAARELRPGEL
jgi:transcription antitermination protein NusB